MEDKAPFAEFTYSSYKKVQLMQVQNANIIIGNPPVELLRGSEKLEWLQLNSAGAGNYIKAGVLSEKVILTNASGAYGLAISEYVIGVLLELYKNLHLYRDNQYESKWEYRGTVKTIWNSTILIVGVGDIGSELAKRVKALGAYTIGIKRTTSNKPDYLDELYLMDKLDDLLPRADVVSLSLPETDLTNKIINHKTLRLMKADAVLINVGRGNAIDTEALCDSLENGHLLGAALDVTDPEPLPKEHRLWKIKNVIITPHVSGGYRMGETHERIIKICEQNLEAYLKGDKIKNIVNRSIGY